MKRLKRILLGILVTFSLCGCSNLPRNVNEISYDEYKSKIDSDETFTVYFGRENCSGCALLKDTFKEMNKKGNDPGTWYYVDITNVDYENILKKEFNDLCHTLLPESAYTQQGYKYDSVYTPTILRFVNGELKYVRIGNILEEEISHLNSTNYVYIAYYENVSKFLEEDSFLFVYDENDREAVYLMDSIIANDESTDIKYFIKKSSIPEAELERLRLLIDNSNPGDNEPLIPELFPTLVCYGYRNGVILTGQSHY